MSAVGERPELSAPQLRRMPDGTMRNMNEHHCGSCHVVHFADYATWCRAERQRLFPHNFDRWTEAEHRTRAQAFSWTDQQTIWEHRDTWEAWFDGRINLQSAREYIASLPPVPVAPSIRHIVRSKRVPAARKPQALTPEQEQDLLDALPTIPEPEA